MPVLERIWTFRPRLHLETGNAALPIIGFREWLAEWARDNRRRQHGLLLTSVHRAKGLEFDHVAVLDGGWENTSHQEDDDGDDEAEEALRLRCLRVPHQPEAVAERLEVHDPVVPDPELLLRPGKVQVLGREQVEDVLDPVAGAGSCACRGRRGSASRRSASCQPVEGATPPLAARYEFCRESIYCLGESVSPTRLTVNWVVPSS